MFRCVLSKRLSSSPLSASAPLGVIYIDAPNAGAAQEEATAHVRRLVELSEGHLGPAGTDIVDYICARVQVVVEEDTLLERAGLPAGLVSEILGTLNRRAAEVRALRLELRREEAEASPESVADLRFGTRRLEAKESAYLHAAEIVSDLLNRVRTEGS